MTPGGSTQAGFTVTFADGSAPLDVRRVVVNEALSDLWSVTILASSSDPNLPFEDLVDRGAACELGGDAPRLWSGIATEIEHLSSEEGGVSQYRVVIRPELWRASVGRNWRVFQHASIPEIVLHLLADWGFAADKNVEVRNFEISDRARFPAYEYRVQAEESDYRFMCRLLEEAGLTFRFEFANTTRGPEGESKGRDLTKLVIDAEPQLGSKARESEEQAEGGGDGGEGDEGEVVELTYDGEGESPVLAADRASNIAVRRALRPGAVTLYDRDFRLDLGARASQTARVRADEGPEEQAPPAESKYEIFHFVPGLQQSEAGEGGDRWTEDREAKRALELLSAFRASTTVVDFVTTNLEIVPGTVVRFVAGAAAHGRDEVGEGKKLLVMETQIVGGASGARKAACRAISADVPYRPMRHSPRPRVFGLQSAIVVGPPGAEREAIHCDAFGRVQVQFHWNRQHRYGAPLSGREGEHLDANGSCWVRVTSPWAGSGYGFVAIPRVGHEVMVAFLDGDPEQPVVVASLHNGPNTTPWPRSTDPLSSGVRTTSLPAGGGGGGGCNELSFCDRAGAEEMRLQAERDMSTVVKSDESYDVGRERTTMVGETDTLHVAEQKWELAVGGNQVGISALADQTLRVHVGGSSGVTILLGKTDVTIEAKGRIHYVASGDLSFSAVGSLNVDGTEVLVKEPGRSPRAAQTDGFVAASPPLSGASIPGGRRPESSGLRLAAPGPIVADVDFGGGQGD